MQLHNHIGFIINLTRLESLQTNDKAPFLELVRYKNKEKSKERRNRENHKIIEVSLLRLWVLFQNQLWWNFLLQIILFFLIFLKRWSWTKSGRFFRLPRLEFKELAACFFFLLLKTLHVWLSPTTKRQPQVLKPNSY